MNKSDICKCCAKIILIDSEFDAYCCEYCASEGMKYDDDVLEEGHCHYCGTACGSSECEECFEVRMSQGCI